MYISKIQELIENGRVISQFAVMLQVSCNKPCWLSKLDVLGAHLSDLKSWMPDVGFKPFPPLGEGRRSSGFWVPSWLWVITMWVVGFMVTLCLSSSYLLPCRFFLIQPMWRSQSASLGFFFFPEELIPYTAVDFSVSVGGTEFKTFRQHHLESIYSSWAFDQPRKQSWNVKYARSPNVIIWVRNGFLIWSCKCTTL